MINSDKRTVAGFGEEWKAFDQSVLDPAERLKIFEDYFSLLPDSALHPESVGADIGCGSGRWAHIVAPKVKYLTALDASPAAVEVARRNLGPTPNVTVVQGDVGRLPFPEGSLDFAYSLGVLHHVPDTQAAIREIGGKLREGAPILLYLYYNFENRSLPFRALWRFTDIARKLICRSPGVVRRLICDVLAVTIYFPLARSAALWESLFRSVPHEWPLCYYRNKSFYVMRTDSLDRFGTSLEQRFSRKKITEMLENSGFEGVKFSDAQPYWTVIAYRKRRL